MRDGANLDAAGIAAARFLRELRQLRDIAGLGQAELAARAHYPRSVIETAESGPALPDLPVLSAYVRGCGGTAEDVAEWEDRWRSVTGAKASPLLPARDAGNSDAASAGARIGATSAAADSHDPAAIMAALDRFASTMATASPSPFRPGSVDAAAALFGGSPRGGAAVQAGSIFRPSPVKGGSPETISAGLPGTVPGMRSPSGSSIPSGPLTGASVSGPARKATPDDPAEHAAASAIKRRVPGGIGLIVGVGVAVVVLLLVLVTLA